MSNETYLKDQPETDLQQFYVQSITRWNMNICTLIPEPEPVLKISGEIIAAAEDIFTISGASKSGKSAFVSMLIGAAISETGQIADGLEGVEVLFNADKKSRYSL